MSTSGIYEILNMQNGNRYIGSAVNVGRRISEHSSRLIGGSHKNVHLQRAWDKYGKDNFRFSKLITCAPKNMIMYEQRFIDGLQPEYNICQIASSLIGHRWSDDSRKKMVGNKNGVGNIGRSKTGLSTNEKLILSKRMKGNKYALGKGKKGEENSRAKLTSTQVIEIRRDGRPYKEISKQYGTCISNISLIKSKNKWGHL